MEQPAGLLSVLPLTVSPWCSPQGQALTSSGSSLSLQSWGASRFLTMLSPQALLVGFSASPSPEQPVPCMKILSILKTQGNFCFSWLDLVIHPGSCCKGLGVRWFGQGLQLSS